MTTDDQANLDHVEALLDRALEILREVREARLAKLAIAEKEPDGTLPTAD